MKKLTKYTIPEIRGYAGKLFREGRINVPLVTQIESFLDAFEEYKEVKNEGDKTKKK